MGHCHQFCQFSFFQQKVPGVFYWLGTRPPDQTPEQAPSNHSPLFYVDESALVLGVRSMAYAAVDYLVAAGNVTASKPAR